MTIPDGLPPLMGFAQETYSEGGIAVDFYTCVVNEWRIFVFNAGGIVDAQGWCVELKSDQPGKGIRAQFIDFDFDDKSRVVNTSSYDAITLMAIIMKITSEGNTKNTKEETKENANTASAV